MARPLKTLRTNVKKYPSKRDNLIAILVWIINILCLTGIILMITAVSANLFLKALVIVALIACIILVTWSFYFTFYELIDEYLFIAHGPFTRIIKLDHIRHIIPSRDLRTSPANSLDRLKITFQKDPASSGTTKLYISPENDREFLREIRKRNSQITVEGVGEQ